MEVTVNVEEDNEQDFVRKLCRSRYFKMKRLAMSTSWFSILVLTGNVHDVNGQIALQQQNER
jgi:hypothetical protein